MSEEAMTVVSASWGSPREVWRESSKLIPNMAIEHGAGLKSRIEDLFLIENGDVPLLGCFTRGAAGVICFKVVIIEWNHPAT